MFLAPSFELALPSGFGAGTTSRAKALRPPSAVSIVSDIRSPRLPPVDLALPAGADHIDQLIRQADARLDADADDAAFQDEYPSPSAQARAGALQLAGRLLQGMHSEKRAASLVPRFEAGADGGVGLHWRTPRLELLLVVPPDGAAPVEFYGDTPSGDHVKGAIVHGRVGFLAEWLIANEFPG